MMKYNNAVPPKVSLKTQFWLFKKQSAHNVVLLFFLVAGLYGLYQGFVFKSKQVNTIESFKAEKNKDLAVLVRGFDADTSATKGKEAYEKVTGLLSANWNIVLPAFKTPSSTSLFCIGQADVFPHYYTVKVEGFFMQLFKQGEIANPLRSLAGHFDTSFWIIYLLPLLGKTSILKICWTRLWIAWLRGIHLLIGLLWLNFAPSWMLPGF